MSFADHTSQSNIPPAARLKTEYPRVGYDDGNAQSRHARWEGKEAPRGTEWRRGGPWLRGQRRLIVLSRLLRQLRSSQVFSRHSKTR